MDLLPTAKMSLAERIAAPKSWLGPTLGEGTTDQCPLLDRQILAPPKDRSPNAQTVPLSVASMEWIEPVPGGKETCQAVPFQCSTSGR